MNKFVLGLLICIILIVAVIGGYYGYPEYQSLTYNDLLKKSDNSWVQVTGNTSQVNLTTTSYDTNIKYIQNSMNRTDEAINLTEQMVNTEPDNATYNYAQIRLSQFKNAKKLEEIILKITEDLKTSGIFGAAAMVQSNSAEINVTGTNIASEQKQLITLVNTNPQLKQRLIDVLGQQRVNEILTPPNGGGIAAAS